MQIEAFKTHRIDSINQQSEEISEVMNALSDIAKQTNILSINAAIESARLGDSGKSFGVIATEIQKLSNTSKQFVLRVNELLNNLNEDTAQVKVTRQINQEQNHAFKEILNRWDAKVEIKDHEGNYYMINAVAAQGYGIPQEEIIGKSVFDFFEEDTARGYHQLENKIIQEQTQNYSLEEVVLHGEVSYLLIQKTGIQLTMDSKGLMVIQREVPAFQIKDPNYISFLQNQYPGIKIMVEIEATIAS